MKLAKNDINRILFGYDTEEEMERALECNRKAYEREKAKEEREEKRFEKWLEKEFY